MEEKIVRRGEETRSMEIYFIIGTSLIPFDKPLLEQTSSSTHA